MHKRIAYYQVAVPNQYAESHGGKMPVGELQVSTATVAFWIRGLTHNSLSRMKLFRYFPLDREMFHSVELDTNIREWDGTYSAKPPKAKPSKRTFPNNVTIRCHPYPEDEENSRNVCLTIAKRGYVSIRGLKTPDDAHGVAQEFFRRLSRVSGTVTVLLHRDLETGFLMDELKYLYNADGSMIGKYISNQVAKFSFVNPDTGSTTSMNASQVPREALRGSPEERMVYYADDKAQCIYDTFGNPVGKPALRFLPGFKFSKNAYKFLKIGAGFKVFHTTKSGHVRQVGFYEFPITTHVQYPPDTWNALHFLEIHEDIVPPEAYMDPFEVNFIHARLCTQFLINRNGLQRVLDQEDVDCTVDGDGHRSAVFHFYHNTRYDTENCGYCMCPYFPKENDPTLCDCAKVRVTTYRSGKITMTGRDLAAMHKATAFITRVISENLSEVRLLQQIRVTYRHDRRDTHR
jgi:Zn-finger protein